MSGEAQPTLWWGQRLWGWLRVPSLPNPQGVEVYRAWGIRVGRRFVGVLKKEQGSI